MKHCTFENATVRLTGGAAALEFFTPFFADHEGDLLVVVFCGDQVELLQSLSYSDSADEVQSSLPSIVRSAVPADCAGLIVAHNYSSGDTPPSKQVVDFTRRLVAAAESVDVVLLDHLIMNDGSVFSFRESGLL